MLTSFHFLSHGFFTKNYYGTVLDEYKGFGAIKLLALVYWLFFLFVLFIDGAEWFYGLRTGLRRLGVFLFPIFGCAMIMFSPLYAGSVFSDLTA